MRGIPDGAGQQALSITQAAQWGRWTYVYLCVSGAVCRGRVCGREWGHMNRVDLEYKVKYKRTPVGLTLNLLPTGSEERKYWGLGVFLLQYFPLVKI